MKREQMLRRLSAMQFAMWESHVFLDTHSGNLEARKMYDEYKAKYMILLKEFEKNFGPITLNANNSDEWLKNPWPWDFQEDDC